MADHVCDKPPKHRSRSPADLPGAYVSVGTYDYDELDDRPVIGGRTVEGDHDLDWYGGDAYARADEVYTRDEAAEAIAEQVAEAVADGGDVAQAAQRAVEEALREHEITQDQIDSIFD